MSQPSLQERGDFFRRLEAVLRLLRHQTVDDGDQPHRDFGVHFVDRSRGVVADAAQDCDRRVGSKRGTPGTHRVQHAAEAEQIAALIDWLAHRLLGRHVLRSPRDLARLRNANIIRRASQSEIGDLHPLDTILQQDVGGLDVAMDEALLVSGSQSRCDLHPDPQNLLQAERTDLVDLLLERLPDDALHDEQRNFVATSCAVIDRMNRDDVIVTDRRRLSLTQEPLPRLRLTRQLGGQHLDRDDAIELAVHRPQYDSHAAAPDDLQNLIASQPAE